MTVGRTIFEMWLGALRTYGGRLHDNCSAKLATYPVRANRDVSYTDALSTTFVLPRLSKLTALCASQD